MNKEFLPYELTLELVQLGFNEPCIATIDQTGFLYIKGTEYPTRGAMFYDELDTPLFQQAFQWFREKHGLPSHIRESFSPESDPFYVAVISGGFVDHGIPNKPFNRFDTYEDAELTCLKRLIEIVKTEEK